MSASSPPHLLLLLLLLATRASSAAAWVSSRRQLWCVAKNNAEDAALQSAIDWACSADGGRADCTAIQQGGTGYDPPNLQSLILRSAPAPQILRYGPAFSYYFLRAIDAANPASCYFSGAAALTALNPSHGRCVFPSSSSPKNGSFTGTTTYGSTGADLSHSSSWKFDFWSWLLHISVSVMFSAATHLL
ncbi:PLASMODESMATA CALLOSE-BINDING PROTEIN 5-like [Phragmites australis]|uniref:PLASMODESMATA CALLOSE-BINDING PROTEIN 5-like n=1 Tax=Phragmites australis TaxID=29695 RepID=UPI002D77891C|nr:PLASMODESMATA CALLOSE-BINDING PROTEIN 5-like [Phragmites australis]